MFEGDSSDTWLVWAKCKHIPDELSRWQANIVTTILIFLEKNGKTKSDQNGLIWRKSWSEKHSSSDQSGAWSGKSKGKPNLKMIKLFLHIAEIVARSTQSDSLHLPAINLAELCLEGWSTSPSSSLLHQSWSVAWSMTVKRDSAIFHLLQNLYKLFPNYPNISGY